MNFSRALTKLELQTDVSCLKHSKSIHDWTCVFQQNLTDLTLNGQHAQKANLTTHKFQLIEHINTAVRKCTCRPTN